MTVADIISAIESQSDKKVETVAPAALLLSDVCSWIKEAMDDIVETCLDYVDYFELPAVNGQKEYTLDSTVHGDIDSIIGVTFNGIPLSRAFLPELFTRHRSSWATLGSKTTPYVYVKFQDEDKIALLPAPTTTQTIGIYCLKSPASVSATTDTIPRYFVSCKRLITDFCMMKSALKDRRSDLAQVWKSLYDAGLSKKTSNISLRSAKEDLMKREDEANK